MNLEHLYALADAEFSGPSMGALPAFKGDKLRPHKGGGGGSSTTTQSIPDELKPLASKYARDAMSLSNTPYQQYGGPLYAQLGDEQWGAIGRVNQRVNAGDSTINSGRGYLENQLNAGEQRATSNPAGAVTAQANQYMGSNPYLDQMVGKAQDSVRSQFNTGAANSGSFGNSGLQEQFQRGLGDVASQMYGSDYANTQQLAEAGINRNMQAQQFNSQMGNDWAQRNDQVKQNQDANQLSSAQLGLQYGNQAYTDADQLMKYGQVKEDKYQQALDSNYQQFQDRQNDPYKKLAAMSGVFSSGIGSTQTSKSSGGGK